MRTRKQKGNIGEIKAIEYLYENGYELYKPLFDNSSSDLIVEKNSKLYRISVKFTSQLTDNGKYGVELRNVSRRKNNKVVIKKFNKNNVDLLVVYIEPLDKVVVIKAKNIIGKTFITVS